MAAARLGRRPPPAELGRARAAGRHLPDIQLRYETLLGRLGPALDGPGTLAEADVWSCILEGTREPSVAEAQAMALTELAARAATAPDGEPRVILLAAYDYSAVAEPVVQVPEPCREPDPMPLAWPQRPASLDDVFGPGTRDEP